jgi:hypothetical protein
LICPKVLTIKHKVLKKCFKKETQIDNLNLKFEEWFETYWTTKLSKKHVLISLGVLKQNIHYLKNICIENLKGTLNLWIIKNPMWNPPNVRSFMIGHTQICNNQHYFWIKNSLANIVFSLSYLQTTSCTLQTTIQTKCTQKSKLENNYILKHITVIYKSNKKMQTKITYLKKVAYCEHQHYHYTYIGGTKNNFSTRNLNKA